MDGVLQNAACVQWHRTSTAVAPLSAHACSLSNRSVLLNFMWSISYPIRLWSISCAIDVVYLMCYRCGLSHVLSVYPSIQCRPDAMWSSSNGLSLKYISSFLTAARLVACNCTPREGLTQDTPRTRQMKLGAIVHGP